MKFETINIILAFVPIYIYYFPNSLIFRFFNKYIDKIFDDFNEKEEIPDGKKKKELLRSKILNLIEFLSLVSLFLGTLVALLVNSNFREKMNDVMVLILFIIYVLLGIILCIISVSKDFKKSFFENFLVNIIVCGSALFILFYLK
jgi:hypothetical protein